MIALRLVARVKNNSSPQPDHFPSDNARAAIRLKFEEQKAILLFISLRPISRGEIGNCTLHYWEGKKVKDIDDRFCERKRVGSVRLELQA